MTPYSNRYAGELGASSVKVSIADGSALGSFHKFIRLFTVQLPLMKIVDVC